MFIRFHLANDDSGVVGKSYDFGGRPSDTNPPGKLVMSCYLINISLLPSKLRRKGSGFLSGMLQATQTTLLAAALLGEQL